MDLTTSPVLRTCLKHFNAVHGGLYEALGLILPDFAAVCISCLIMSTLIVSPVFLPLLVCMSRVEESEEPRQSSTRAMPVPSKPSTMLEEVGGTADVETWDVEEVCKWLEHIELAEHVESFTKHKISGTLLLQLTEGEIATDLKIERLADRKRLAAEINALQRRKHWWSPMSWIRDRWAGGQSAAAAAKKRA